MKYKVGDWVKVRSDLQWNKVYSGVICINSMLDYAGHAFEIKCVNDDGEVYQIGNSPFFWSEDMFEGPTSDTSGMTVEELIRWFKSQKQFGYDVFGMNLYGILDYLTEDAIVQTIKEYKAKKDPAIDSVVQEYYVSRDEYAPPMSSSGWAPTIPNIWTRSVITYTNGEKKTTDPEKITWEADNDIESE